METSTAPQPVRRLLILSVVFLVISVVVAGFNAYVTIAAPLRSPYVPCVVGFDGQLANSAGQPVAHGNFQNTFMLYSQASGGNALCNELQTVEVTNGLYSVQLGSVNDLNPTDF